jgi:hypothetical protein
MVGESEFVPARGKAEVVVRISNLTNSGPEVLGPGSKERKSVLVNLAKGLGIEINERDSKQELGRLIAETFGRKWLQSHESVGQTITLDGLNLLLEIGTVELGVGSLGGWPSNINEQAAVMANSITRSIPKAVDGHAAILEMQANSAQWKQTEWHGFYFEMKARSVLISDFGGGPKKILNTTFDYVNTSVWDLKSHSEINSAGKSTSSCQLNDKSSMEEAIRSGGMGLVILCIESKRTLEFATWHKNQRGSTTEPRKALVAEFKSLSVEFYWIPNTARLKSAIARREISTFSQGKNSNGKAREPKYSINLKKARDSDLLVFRKFF